MFKNKYFDNAKMSITESGETQITLYKNNGVILSGNTTLIILLTSASIVLHFNISIIPPDNNDTHATIILYKYHNRIKIKNKKLQYTTKQELDNLFVKIEKLFDTNLPEYINKFNNEII